MVAIRSHFDGKVFVPDEPVDLPRGQSVILHVEPQAKDVANGQVPNGNLWDVLDSMTGSIEAPADWSAEHDHYLYGSPKHNGEAGK